MDCLTGKFATKPGLSDSYICAEVADCDIYKLLHPLPDKAFPEVLSNYHLRSCEEYLQQQWFADEAKGISYPMHCNN